MIRKILLSTVAIAAAATSAFAADLPSRRSAPVYAPPPPVPVFTWTGFYVGGDVGYGFGQDRVVQVAAPIGAGPSVRYNDGSPNGIVGGAHVGYNISTQSLPILGGIAGGLSGIPFIGGVGGTGGVAGIEGDVRGSDYRSGVAFGTFSESNRNQIQGTVRGRLGIAVDRALFFATGGVAFAQFQNNYAAPVLGGFQSFSNTRVGWVVGGGIEYAITTNFSLRAEYRYEDFGRYTNALVFTTPTGFTATHHDTEQMATVGFSYKFASPMPVGGPVVARY